VAIKGAIHINEPPTNYRFKASVSSAYTLINNSAIVNAYSFMEVSWGIPSPLSFFGIEIFNEYKTGAPFPGSGSVYTINHPWGSAPISIFPGTWLNNINFRIEVDNLQLDVNEDCEWRLRFTSMRFIINETLHEEVVNIDVTGTSFDLRYDIVKLKSETMVGLLVPDCVSIAPPDIVSAPCEGSFASYPTSTQEASINITGGWEWLNGTVWETDEVKLASITLPASECECLEFFLPTCLDEHSLDISVSAAFSRITSKTPTFGTLTCVCADVVMNQNQRFYWARENNFYYYTEQVSAIPYSSGLTEYDNTGSRTCPLHTDVLTSSGIGLPNQTRSLIKASTTFSELYIECAEVVGLDLPCIAPADCVPLFPTPIETSCCTVTKGEIVWNDPPICTDTPSGMIDVYHHVGGDWHCVLLNDETVYWKQKKDPTTQTVTIDALWADIECSPDLTFIDVLFTDQTRKRFVSGGAVIVLAPKATMISFRNAIDTEGKILCIWQDGDGNLFSNYNEEGDNPISLQVGENLYDVTYYAGAFILTADESLTTYYSYDRGLSWTGL